MPELYPVDESDDSSQALYRFWDAEGALLYIGITHRLNDRLSHHKKFKPWWWEVAAVTIERYPDRESVAAAEVLAIKTESPKYNVMLNGDTSPQQSPLWSDQETSLLDLLDPKDLEAWLAPHMGRDHTFNEWLGIDSIPDGLSDSAKSAFVVRAAIGRMAKLTGHSIEYLAWEVLGFKGRQLKGKHQDAFWRHLSASGWTVDPDKGTASIDFRGSSGQYGTGLPPIHRSCVTSLKVAGEGQVLAETRLAGANHATRAVLLESTAPTASELAARWITLTNSQLLTPEDLAHMLLAGIPEAIAEAEEYVQNYGAEQDAMRRDVLVGLRR